MVLSTRAVDVQVRTSTLLASELVVGLFVVAFAVACSNGGAPSSTTSTATTSQPILNGADDPTDTSVMVVLSCFGPCTFGKNGLNVQALCSSTLVAPNLLVTARHCVAPILGDPKSIECPGSTFGATREADSFLVSPNGNVYGGGPFLRVEAVDVPPGDEVCGHDLAVVRLAQPYVGSAPYVPNIAKPPTVGEDYSAIGYGDNVATGGGSGVRRRLDGLKIACIGAACPLVLADGTPAVVEAEFAGTIGTCPGDSGGPALGAGNVLLGAVSRGDSECRHPISPRLDAWGAWLEARAAEAAMAGGYPVPAWALEPAGPDGALDAGVRDGATDGAGGSGPGGDAGFPFPVDAAAGGTPQAGATPGPLVAGGGCSIVAGADAGDRGAARNAGAFALALAAAACVRRRRLRLRARRAKLVIP